MARHAGHQYNAAVLGAIGDHLPGCQLGREVETHDIDGQQALVRLVGKLQEGQMAIDACTRHANVESIVEVGLELLESGGQGGFGGDVHPVRSISHGSPARHAHHLPVIGRSHTARLLNGVELGFRLSHVEDGHVGPGFGQTLRKGEAASPGAAGDEGCSSLERKLRGQRGRFR